MNRKKDRNSPAFDELSVMFPGMCCADEKTANVSHDECNLILANHPKQCGMLGCNADFRSNGNQALNIMDTLLSRMESYAQNLESIGEYLDLLFGCIVLTGRLTLFLIV